MQRLALAEVDIWRDWVERAEREVGTAMRQPLLVQPPQEAASGWPLARIKLPELSDHVQAAQQARCLGIAVPPFLRGAALALPLMLEAGRRLQALLQQLAEVGGSLGRRGQFGIAAAMPCCLLHASAAVHCGSSASDRPYASSHISLPSNFLSYTESAQATEPRAAAAPAGSGESEAGSPARDAAHALGLPLS